MARRRHGVPTGTGSLTTVAREVAERKLNLTGVQEVKLNKGGNE
jgi:hypothetical protein